MLDLLTCPHCAGGLAPVSPGVVGCAPGHRFDLARQGYLSLLGKDSRTDTGDDPDMVAARSAFLGAGHYRPVAAAVAERVTAAPFLDIGAGTGYYLGAALDRAAAGPGGRPVGIALDASRFAARRAAAAHPAIGAIVADAWSPLPVRDGAVGTVLSVFAPRRAEEIDRVLGPDGRVVVVTPETDHLGEIRGDLGMLTVDPGKPERLVQAFRGRLVEADRRMVSRTMYLSRQDVSALVRMGPSARHLAPDRLSRAIGQLAATTPVTLRVTVTVLRRP